MKNFVKTFSVLVLLFSYHDSHSTVVSSVTQSVALNFGKIAGNTGGTITSAGVVTGSVKKIGTSFLNGSFTVARSNVNPKAFAVYLVSVPANLTASANTAPLILSLNTTFSQAKNYSGPIVFTKGTSQTIPVYGRLTVSGTQAAGNYSGSYTVYACACSSTTVCPAYSAAPC